MSNFKSKLQRFFLIYPVGECLIALSSIVTLGVFLWIMLNQTSPIATVDITQIVQHYVQAQAKLNLPQQEIKERVNVFGQQLETTLKEVAQQKHVVLMPQEAVIAGAQDLTPLIEQRLQQFQSQKR